MLGSQRVKRQHFTLRITLWVEDVALIKYALYLLLVNHRAIDSLYRRGRLELSLQGITCHYRFEVIGRQPMLPFRLSTLLFLLPQATNLSSSWWNGSISDKILHLVLSRALCFHHRHNHNTCLPAWAQRLGRSVELHNYDLVLPS